VHLVGIYALEYYYDARTHERYIKIIVTETGLYGVEWIYLAHNKNMWWTLANAVMNHGDMQSVGNCFSSTETISFLRRSLLHGSMQCNVDLGKQISISFKTENLNFL